MTIAGGRGRTPRTKQHTPESPLERGLWNSCTATVRNKKKITWSTVIIPLFRGVPEGRGVLFHKSYNTPLNPLSRGDFDKPTQQP